jgi:hypothetical protein
MNKITLYLLSIIVFVILSNNEGFACSCNPSSDEPLAEQVKKAKTESNAVFTGRVVKKTEYPESGYTVVKLKIIDLWKGSHSKVITVLTGSHDGNCRYHFEVDKTYLIYAHNSSMYSSVKSLETTMCSRTQGFSDAKADINILDKSRNSQKNKKLE